MNIAEEFEDLVNKFKVTKYIYRGLTRMTVLFEVNKFTFSFLISPKCSHRPIFTNKYKEVPHFHDIT